MSGMRATLASPEPSPQLTLADIPKPDSWPCPGCRGAGCRACRWEGHVPWDPDDHEAIPY